ncbi:DNA-binding response regulator [Saccharibacillus sp. O16]|nr:DNA-binding response regulator [Saccharibacillus sp. O16]
MAYRVLVVEDDKEILEGVSIYLRNQGYEVLQAADGVDGLKQLEKGEVHLAVVDVMMPRMDGISMTMKLREKYDFPVIFLSAKSEEIDKVAGLNIGGDDYIAKPFAPMELLARVNSQIRRYARYLSVISSQETKSGRFSVGGLELDEETVEVWVDEVPVRLTPMEFKILHLLIRHPGRVFSADEIYERLWNDRAVATETVMVHIRNIREKIEINPKNPKYLKVVWGVGYKIEKQ